MQMNSEIIKKKYYFTYLKNVYKSKYHLRLNFYIKKHQKNVYGHVNVAQNVMFPCIKFV